jgi:exodeoxyribonuclease VII small subunit
MSLTNGFVTRMGCAIMPPAESPPMPFEQALAELDAILRELEDGTTTLEDALARYERGVTLLRQCYGQLRDAEQKVKLLSGLTDDGAAELKPIEHVASFDAASTGRKTPRPVPDAGIPE